MFAVVSSEMLNSSNHISSVINSLLTTGEVQTKCTGWIWIHLWLLPFNSLVMLLPHYPAQMLLQLVASQRVGVFQRA